MTHPGGGKFVDWGISWSWQNFLVLTFSLPNGSGQLNLNDNQSFSGDPAQVADSYITSGYLTCAGSGYVGCSTQDNFSVNFQHGPFPTSQYVTDHVDFVYNMLSTTALFGDVTGYCDATYLDDFPINTYTG